MFKYLLGFFKHIFSNRVSFLSSVDYKSRISRKAKVYRGVQIYDSTIDSYTYVGPKSEIIYADIAKFCSIADNCSIGLPTHSMNNLSTSPIFTAKKNGTGYRWTHDNTIEEYRRTIIGNDVWIGTRALILGGVKIGNGAIIGAGSIVTKDIPDYSIAVGIPAKVIRYRFDESIIEKLLELKWWDLPDDKLKEKIVLFQKENFSLQDLKEI